MLEERTWKEFRDTGLLMFINFILHAFGWTIVVELDQGEVIRVYPARTKFRGFDEETQTKNFKKIAKYLKENANDLYEEVEDE